MRAFRRDPATIKIDYALKGPVPWTVQPPYPPGTVHIADTYEEMAVFCGQLSGGVIPDKPFLLIGQMTVAGA
jgi:phytoene dehydrogenase-like protein